MSNYNFSPTLDGLNQIDSNNINTDTIICDYLTVDINSSVPTLSSSTNTNQIASTAFVQSVVSSIPVINNYVTTDTSQTLTTGIKTFTNLPECSAVPTSLNQLVNKQYVDNGDFVNLTTNQTINGIKTFNNNLVVGSGINTKSGSNLTLNTTGGEDVVVNGSNDITFNSTFNTVFNAGAYGSFSAGVGYTFVNNGNYGFNFTDNAGAGGSGLNLTTYNNNIVNTSVSNYDYNSASIFSPYVNGPNRGAIYNNTSPVFSPTITFNNGQAVDVGTSFSALLVSVPIGNTCSMIRVSIPFDLLAWSTFGFGASATATIGLRFDGFTVVFLKNGIAYTPSKSYSYSPATGTTLNWNKTGAQTNVQGIGAYFGNLEIAFNIDINNTSIDSYQVRVTPNATITNYSINFDAFKFVCRNATGAQTNGNGFRTTSVTAYTGGTMTFAGGNPSFVDTSVNKLSFSYPEPTSSNYCFMPLNNNINPPSMISAFLTTSVDGWLYCDGASVSIATYPNLFNAIAFTYGGSFSSGNFNLPDFRGMFLRSSGSKTVSGVTYTAPAVGSTVQQDAVLNATYSSNNGFRSCAAGTRDAVARFQITTDPVDTTGILANFPREATENRPVNMSVYYHIKY